MQLNCLHMDQLQLLYMCSNIYPVVILCITEGYNDINGMMIVILNIAACYALFISSLYIFHVHAGFLSVLLMALHLEELSQTRDSSSLVHCSLVNARA